MLLKDGRYVDIQDRDDFSRLILEELGEDAQRLFLEFCPYDIESLPEMIANLAQDAAESVLDSAAFDIADRVERDLKRFYGG